MFLSLSVRKQIINAVAHKINSEISNFKKHTHRTNNGNHCTFRGRKGPHIIAYKLSVLTRIWEHCKNSEQSFFEIGHIWRWEMVLALWKCKFSQISQGTDKQSECIAEHIQTFIYLSPWKRRSEGSDSSLTISPNSQM